VQDVHAYDDAIAAAAARHGIPPAWVAAVIGTETSFVIPAPSTWEPAVNQYARGPMQILLSTARELVPAIDAAALDDPATNIDIGAAYLRQLADRFGFDFSRVYSAYNSGNPDRYTDPSSATAGNVQRALQWLEQFTPAETAGAGILAAGAAAAAALWLWKRGKHAHT
jgi:soluble lytic murein transglycosylase-like protein